jgi:NAD(P)-dependent dehydrogenase (short-subunit alcohol dehydrogenase family)
VPANLAEESECLRLAADVEANEATLDVLVNNAGANWGEAYESFPESGWDKVLALNLKAPFFLTRACTAMLAKSASAADPSRVINVGSVDGIKTPGLETYSYSASKAGVHMLTRTLAKRLSRRHITVNAIAPGPFESKMMHATIEQFGDAMRATNPMGRLGEPDDMAGVAIYLASRASTYVTGAVIPVDGGMAVLS